MKKSTKQKKLSLVMGTTVAAFAAGSIQASDLAKSKEFTPLYTVADHHEGKEASCKGKKKKKAKAEKGAEHGCKGHKDAKGKEGGCGAEGGCKAETAPADGEKEDAK